MILEGVFLKVEEKKKGLEIDIKICNRYHGVLEYITRKSVSQGP